MQDQGRDAGPDVKVLGANRCGVLGVVVLELDLKVLATWCVLSGLI